MSIDIALTSAHGVLGKSSITVEFPATQSEITVPNVTVPFDFEALMKVDSKTPALLTVTVTDTSGDQVLSTHEESVSVHPHQFWPAAPLALGLDLLPTFVQPNQHVIAETLRAASDLLQERTGSSSIDGYQSDSPERIDAIAEAIYDSIRHRDIRYAEPPASWGLSGQKIRSPRDVLDQELGTCLDLALMLAAALEEAGVNSTLWLTSGHAFLGYWRTDGSLSTPSSTDATEAVNRVGLGDIGLIETTCLTVGDTSQSFASARNWLQEVSPSSVRGVVDIRKARMAQVHPLPSINREIPGESIIQTYQAAPFALPSLSELPEVALDLQIQDVEPVPARIQRWKDQLLDLSLRNRLINFTGAGALELTVPAAHLVHLERLIRSGAAVKLRACDDLSSIDEVRGFTAGSDLPAQQLSQLLTSNQSLFASVSSAKYTSSLRSLARKARSSLDETGAHTLYLTAGMLRWNDDGRELRAPVALIPVTLTSTDRGQNFRLSLAEHAEITPNFSLFEKIRSTHGLNLLSGADQDRSHSLPDVQGFITQMRRSIVEQSAPFTVEDAVWLGNLRFSTFDLWRDIDRNWETLSVNPLVTHLIHTPTLPFFDDVDAPSDVNLDQLGDLLPLPADSTQLEAIAEAGTGRTFVLEGPPGTGKSQTIANLIADSLTKGKKVLFVAEKQAALSVVKDRLTAIGLDPFINDLPQYGTRVAVLKERLRQSLARTSSGQGHGRIGSEASIIAEHRDILTAYADAVHQHNSIGLSLHSAHAQRSVPASNPTEIAIPRSLLTHGTPEVIDTIRLRLRRLPEFTDAMRLGPPNPWGFIDFTRLDESQLGKAHAAAAAFDRALQRARAELGDTTPLSHLRTAEDAALWAQAANMPPLLLALTVGNDDAAKNLRDLSLRLQALTAQLPHWTSWVKPEILQQDVRGVHAAVQAAASAPFLQRTSRLRNLLKQHEAYLLVKPHAILTRDIPAIFADIAITHDDIISIRGRLIDLGLAGPHWNPFIDGQAHATHGPLRSAIRFLETFNHERSSDFIRALHSYCRSGIATQDFPLLDQLSNAWAALDDSHDPVKVRDGSALSEWAGAGSIIDTWIESQEARDIQTTAPVTLSRWIQLAQHLQPLLTYRLDALYESVWAGRISADDALSAFDVALAEEALNERRSTPALERFDAEAHERTMRRWQQLRTQVRHDIPAWMADQIIAHRQTALDSQDARFGKLTRHINSTKSRGTSRSLFTHYGDLVADILPCTLGSPHTVARYLPTDGPQFDLVIFDEASQIRVADAIGAMGRARSVVVVGDTKQLPPTSVAKSVAEFDLDLDDLTEHVVDEESILSECVQARVPQKYLTWHYRSQDQSLMSFSNARYYDDQLSSFPAPPGSSNTGISLVRVDGQFVRAGQQGTLRTNLAEAEAIVAEVEKRFEPSSNELPSLGIVTLNVQQRSLIESLLRGSPNSRISEALDAPAGLFVKNLENVQGDERDVILISVAFSKDVQGRLPLNLGPITHSGGERRLNVALTRARREMLVYASFDPADLKIDRTASVGVAHLREFLAYAAAHSADSSIDTPKPSPGPYVAAIANGLSERGYKVITGMGQSSSNVDLAVMLADTDSPRAVALLVDGPEWYARQTIADRDELPDYILTQHLNWANTIRVWLPEWLDDPERALDRIEAQLRVTVQTGRAN